MTKILLTGKTGQIGFELQRSLAAIGQVVSFDRAKLDLSSVDSIRAKVREVQPQIIVNAAAYTAVDKAESEPDLAMQVNGVAPGIMAREAKRFGALLVHYSTDYVFDGSKATAYVETDSTHPLGVYGETKLAGERAIEAVGGAHLILRTSWVYAARGHNFLRTILRLARERSELRIVNDQIGAPTWARTIAEITARILASNGGGLYQLREKSSLYHLTAAGATSWYGFAEAILAEAKGVLGKSVPRLIPIPTSEYPLPARRPANSRLDNAKLTSAFGLTPPPWDEMLKSCIHEMGNR